MFFMFCSSDAIADGNRCLHDVLKLVASAVSSSSYVLSDNYFCENCHDFVGFKTLSEVKVAKHESLQKLVSSSGGEKANLISFAVRLAVFSKTIQLFQE